MDSVPQKITYRRLLEGEVICKFTFTLSNSVQASRRWNKLKAAYLKKTKAFELETITKTKPNGYSLAAIPMFKDAAILLEVVNAAQ